MEQQEAKDIWDKDGPTTVKKHENTLSSSKKDEVRDEVLPKSSTLTNKKTNTPGHKVPAAASDNGHSRDQAAELKFLRARVKELEMANNSGIRIPNKRQNLIIMGVEECAKGTYRDIRMSEEREKVILVLKDVDDLIESRPIKDVYRLGKFDENHKKPRPLLVKFERTTDVMRIWQKKGLVSQKYQIKEDVPKQERIQRSILGKERKTLIEGGTDQRSIKVQKSSIYVDGVLYGHFNYSGSFICISESSAADDHSADTLENKVEQSLREAKEKVEKKLREAEDKAERRLKTGQEVEQRLRGEVVETKKKLREVEDSAAEGERRLKEAEGRAAEGERRLKEAEDRAAEGKRRLKEAEDRAAEGERRLVVSEKRVRESLQRLGGQWVVERKEIQLTGQELGKGDWATVSVATFRGMRVAAKCIHKQTIFENMNQFKQEMEIVARMRHPNIVLFIGATQIGELIILTELMPTSLRKELKHRQSEHSHMPLKQITSIGVDIARALNYLHLMQPQPLIYLNISSAHTLLELLPNSCWRAKVSSYGTLGLLQTNIPGNATYAAPEAFDLTKHSPKMNIFSFGVLLMEMLTGEIPDSSNRARQLRKISHQPLLDLVQRCLSPDISNRPSASDVIAELDIPHHIAVELL